MDQAIELLSSGIGKIENLESLYLSNKKMSSESLNVLKAVKDELNLALNKQKKVKNQFGEELKYLKEKIQTNDEINEKLIDTNQNCSKMENYVN